MKSTPFPNIPYQAIHMSDMLGKALGIHLRQKRLDFLEHGHFQWFVFQGNQGGVEHSGAEGRCSFHHWGHKASHVLIRPLPGPCVYLRAVQNKPPRVLIPLQLLYVALGWKLVAILRGLLPADWRRRVQLAVMPRIWIAVAVHRGRRRRPGQSVGRS